MTYTARPETTGRVSDTGWHVITAILAIVGIVGAAMGAWMAYGPDSGLLKVFGWTWNVVDIRELWAPILMIGGGALAALTMGVESARDWNAQNRALVIWMEALLAVLGIAAIVVGLVFLF